MAVAGATSTIYTILATPADNGAQISCQASLAAPYNVNVTGLNSTTAHVTVLAGLEYPGLKQEVWAGAVRTEVENGNTGLPTWLGVLSDFDNAGGLGDYYTRRVSGWLIPPTDGDLRFLYRLG